MQIRLGDTVQCRHGKTFKALSEEEINEELRYFAIHGTSKPLFSYTDVLVDKTEVCCPDCGKTFKVGDDV